MVKEKFAPRGVYCAMITPFDENGKPDLEKIGQHIEFLIEKKVDGVFAVSNVGEFLLLSMEDKKNIVKTVVERGRGRIKVIPGVSDLVLDHCLELADYCKEAGADGVVVCAPYYYPYSQGYIKQFITTVADKSPLPIILYNSPSFTNAIAFENLIELCRHENITAVKESSGDAKFLVKLMAELDRQSISVNILMGWEELFLTGLTHGACGCIVSSAGIIPEIMVSIYQAFRKGDSARALLCQKAVAAVIDEIKIHGFPHGYKLGVMARGLDFHLFAGKAFAGEEAAMRGGLEKLKCVIQEQLKKTGCI